LQCVAVCCSVLQCVAVCCGVLRCVAVCCGVLQCVVNRCHLAPPTINDACHMHARVMSHMSMRHGTHTSVSLHSMNESCHMYECDIELMCH